MHWLWSGWFYFILTPWHWHISTITGPLCGESTGFPCIPRGKDHKCRAFMMTSSNGNIFRTTGHSCGDSQVTGEFPAQRPVTRSFDVFFDLHLNKRLSKQSWGWWFETLSCSLWRIVIGSRLTDEMGPLNAHVTSSLLWYSLSQMVYARS